MHRHWGFYTFIYISGLVPHQVQTLEVLMSLPLRLPISGQTLIPRE